MALAGHLHHGKNPGVSFGGICKQHINSASVQTSEEWGYESQALDSMRCRMLCGNESLAMMMSTPGLIRDVALAGHLHHGKTLVGL